MPSVTPHVSLDTSLDSLPQPRPYGPPAVRVTRAQTGADHLQRQAIHSSNPGQPTARKPRRPPFPNLFDAERPMRPGYQYLAHHKISGLLARPGAALSAPISPRSGGHRPALQHRHRPARCRTGRRAAVDPEGQPLAELTMVDLDELAAAFQAGTFGVTHGQSWSSP